MDLTLMSAALGNLKTATEIAKLIKDSDLSLDKAEMKLKLADLISALADAKLDIVSLQEKLADAEGRIKQIEAERDQHANVRWQEPLYWLDGESASDGPYCQHCYDSVRKLMRLQGDDTGWYRCTVCQNNYQTTEARQKEATGRSADAARLEGCADLVFNPV